MAKLTSAQKANKGSIRKATANKPIRSALKTEIKVAEALVRTGDPAAARKAVMEATIALDKAVSKKVAHKNNAARRKSRLMRKLNAASKPKG